MAYVTITKCKAFLMSLFLNSDVEVKCEDFFESLKNCDTNEDFEKYMNVNCSICFSKHTMNKVYNL